MELKDFQHLPSVADSSRSTPIASSAPPPGIGLADGLKTLFEKRRRELVAGGDVKWKPINKQAALLLAKSPDICKPATTMPHVTDNIHSMSPKDPGHRQAAEETDGRLLSKLTHLAEKMPGQLQDYATLLASAKASLDMGTDLFRQSMVDFSEELPKHMEKLRGWRMAMERERDASLKAMRELRQFFLEDAHEKEMMRLNEFVRMCERLGALAKDGTLEAVADVMLKLS
jgi:hypothetical protein